MKKEQVIKLTVTRYYDPSESKTIDYSDLLESIGLYDSLFNVSAKGKEWLRNNLKGVASYDKHSIDEGIGELRDFLEISEGEEPLEYLFEVVEFTTHDNGDVTEEVIHTVKDAEVVLEDFGPVPEPPRPEGYGEVRAEEDKQITENAVLFYELHGRVPNLGELLMMEEARSSAELDRGDGETWSVETRKPND